MAGLHPLVNIHDLVGALHLPGDSMVSPPDVNHALAVAAAGYGRIKAIYRMDQFNYNPLENVVYI